MFKNVILMIGNKSNLLHWLIRLLMVCSAHLFQVCITSGWAWHLFLKFPCNCDMLTNMAGCRGGDFGLEVEGEVEQEDSFLMIGSLCIRIFEVVWLGSLFFRGLSDTSCCSCIWSPTNGRIWLDLDALETKILLTPWYQFPKIIICLVTSRFNT